MIVSFAEEYFTIWLILVIMLSSYVVLCVIQGLIQQGLATLKQMLFKPILRAFSGTGKFGFSFVRITALMLTTDRLWVGTGNGVILSVPLVSSQPTRETEGEPSKSLQTVPAEDTTRSRASSGSNLFMPYCAMVNTSF